MNTFNSQQQSIARLQQRLAKAQAQDELRREQLAALKQKAFDVFGTDDVELIRQKVEAIRQNNIKREQFRANVLTLASNILSYVESGQVVPQELLLQLEKANGIASKASGK